MKDTLLRALAMDENIRIYGLNATQAVKEAKTRHDTYNGGTIALGKTLMAGLLLGGTLKGEDKLTIKVQGDGILGAIVVDSDAKGHVKGYVKNPHVYIQPDENMRPSLPATIGKNGILTVIKDLGLKEAFSGQVPLVAGDISQDITYYMASSEQVPSAVSLCVNLDEDGKVISAGGFMLQVLPGASEEVISAVENSLQQAEDFAKALAKGISPAEYLKTLVGELVILDEMPVEFLCDCSKEKFGQAIIALGEKEITEMIEEDHGAEAVCQFCNNHYHYSEEDLIALRNEAMV